MVQLQINQKSIVTAIRFKVIGYLWYMAMILILD